MILKKTIASKIYEPLYSNFYRRDKRIFYYRMFDKMQWNSLEDNLKYQRNKLYKILKYSIDRIPYYQRVAKDLNISINEETIFNDIKKFPVLTKDIINKEFKNLYCLNDKRWAYNTSGGSTGKQVKFIQDESYNEQSVAIARLQEKWAGYSLGDIQIQLWGSERDLLKEKEKIKTRFSNWIKSIYLLNSFMMDEKSMLSYVNFINKRKPKLILAYAESMFEFANFIKINNLDIYSPQSIMTTAGMLSNRYRDLIEKVFRCPVFNRYGSREVYSIASECESHDGLHLSIFTQYFEILNESLESCNKNEVGDVYITTLTNYAMPLIRYKIGDRARFANNECKCGRGIPLIKDILGRSGIIIRTKKIVLDSTALTTSFYYFDSIKQYQFIQKEIDYIVINIVLNNKGDWNKDKLILDHKLKEILGKDLKIDYNIVTNIKPTKSGKHLYFLSEI